MRRIILSVVALSMLAGCVSPISQQNLFVFQQQCAAGIQEACSAAFYQAQANQQEAAQNAQAAVAGLAILGAVGAGIAIGANSGGYHHHHRGW